MKRREFIALLGSAAIVRPVGVRAQSIPLIGFLRNTVADRELVAAFREGLKEVGYQENQDVTVDYEWTEGHRERLSALASDLVGRHVSVIVAGGNEAIRAAKSSTSTIPIIFASGEDPVKANYVTSLNRPNTNVTGVTFYSGAVLEPKQLQLIHQLVPNARVVALLANPHEPATFDTKAMQNAASSLGIKVQQVDASSEHDFVEAFARIAEMHAGALVVAGNALFTSRRPRIVALAASHAIPTVYNQREYARSGGLMSYGSNIATAYHQAGYYAGRILKGDKPADLPVLRPTKFELVINLKTAKALGLTVPPSMQIAADEIIE
jgi:ABC-type uncharacterized transport system substrate-binding protein